MSLGVNLLKLKVDSLTRIEVFRRPYDNSSLLDEIREQLEPGQVVTRLGEKLWGHALPPLIIEKYGFSQAIHLFVALDPKLANRLIWNAVYRRLQQLGFRRVGYNKFEQLDEIAFTLGDEGELMARPRWLVRPFSLPRGTENVFGLLVNPRLAYRFTINLQQLSDRGFDWSYFGDKIRAVTEVQVSEEDDS